MTANKIVVPEESLSEGITNLAITIVSPYVAVSAYCTLFMI